jgi:UDP-N-acetylglucosamine 2-epimerase (non-hydrolysing)
MDVGTLVMAGTKPEDVISAIEVVTKSQMAPTIPDYDVENVSEQVLKIILSYTHYVNRYVWRKNI